MLIQRQYKYVIENGENSSSGNDNDCLWKALVDVAEERAKKTPNVSFKERLEKNRQAYLKTSSE